MIFQRKKHARCGYTNAACLQSATALQKHKITFSKLTFVKNTYKKKTQTTLKRILFSHGTINTSYLSTIIIVYLTPLPSGIAPLRLRTTDINHPLTERRAGIFLP